MRKLFEEYGSIIITVAAVVALISLLIVLMVPGGVLDEVFGSITNSFLDKSSNLLFEDFSGPRLSFDRAYSEDANSPTLIDSGEIVLSGSVSDESGVASVFVNGESATMGANGEWTIGIEAALHEVKEISIVATDGNGNVTERTLYVRYVDFIPFKVTEENRAMIGYTGAENEDLVIPETFEAGGVFYRVEELDVWCFRKCMNLRSVVVPDSVQTIDHSVFLNCENLETVTLGSGFQFIKYSVFSGCAKLTDIYVDERNTAYCSVDGVLYSKDKATLVVYPAGRPDTSFVVPNTVTTIGTYAFSDCLALTKVVMPDSVVTVSDDAFWMCKNLSDVTIGQNVTYLGRYSFGYCESLQNIVIPDKVEVIGPYSFSHCDLQTVSIPASVTSMDGAAFYNCRNLTNIHVDVENTVYSSIDGILYSKDTTQLLFYPGGKTNHYFAVPSNVTTIAESAFNSVSADFVLDEIYIPASVVNIEAYAFYSSTFQKAVFEVTDGWWVAADADATSGTALDMSDSELAADYLTINYSRQYFRRS